MSMTSYHTMLFAYELTKQHAADSDEKLIGALVDAQVDLNPHQVDAALFAFKSPLSKGALLADEVGLGKTIEAGLVLSQNVGSWSLHRLIYANNGIKNFKRNFSYVVVFWNHNPTKRRCAMVS